MRVPWNNWYHVTGSTRGTWFRGDPRGWRARHHREHCEGDYKNPPPPDKHRAHLLMSMRLSKRRIMLTKTQREFACRALGEALVFRDVELVDLCIGAKHFHILARFRPLNPAIRPKDPNRTPRHLVGLAKKRSAREMSKAGLIDEGGVWALRSRALPIKDRAHRVNVARYIRAHARKGAAVWSILRKKDELSK